MKKPVDGIRVAHIGQSTTLASVAASALGYGNKHLVTSEPRKVDASFSKLGNGAHVPLPSGEEGDFLDGVPPWDSKPNL